MQTSPKQYRLVALLLTSLLISHSATHLHAQSVSATAVLRGTVVEAMHHPAAFATVSLFRSPDSIFVKGTITTEQGTYILESLSPGVYYLMVSAVGYRPAYSDSVSLSVGQIREQPVLQLQPTAQTLQEVVVTSQQLLVEQQTDKIVLNVAGSALAQGNTALELLQKAPGVAVDGDQVSLRGKPNVSILIDGKPTYLSTEQIATLLRTTGSATIQAIEIITNPSAKYDAAGNGGIINIVLKKNQQYGTNGTLNLSGGYGRYPKTEAGASLNYRQQRLNAFVNYGYGYRHSYNDLRISRSLDGERSQLDSDLRSTSTYRTHAHNGKAGLDWSLTPRTTLGLLLTRTASRQQATTTSRNRIGQPGKGPDSLVVGLTQSRPVNDYQAYTLNYRSVLDTVGSELTASVDYVRSAGDNTQALTNRYTDLGGLDYRPALQFTNRMPTEARIYVGKVDWVHLVDKTTRLEAGVKYSQVQTDNTLTFDVRQPDQTYRIDSLRSNQFAYRERISAAYVSASRDWGRIRLQVGLRAEHTQSQGNAITQTNLVRRSYLNWFPTLFVKHKVSTNSLLGLSYTRRIDRPDYGSLNPFVYYVDQYTYNRGNPYLNPQYTQSYELSYGYKNQYLVSLNYSHTANAISNVILSDTVTRSIFRTKQNLATFNYYSLNLTAPLLITRWWTTYTNLTLFYSQFRSPNVNGEVLNLQRGSYQLSTNQVITLGKTTTIEVNANYFAPSAAGTYIRSTYYGLDLGINQSWRAKKGSIKLAVSDLFNTRSRQSMTSNLPNNRYEALQTNETRIIRLSLSYRFGNTQLKATDKKSGAESEEKRLTN